MRNLIAATGLGRSDGAVFAETTIVVVEPATFAAKAALFVVETTAWTLLLALHAEGLGCTFLTYTERTALCCRALALVELLAALAELLELTVEHLVLAELAGKGTVEEGDDDRGLQPNLVEALLAVAQYPCIVALEGMLEPLAAQTSCPAAFGRGENR